MYARVVIAQTTGPDQTEALRSIFLKHIRSEMVKNAANVGANFMVEDGGNMILIITHWTSRENCLKYHCSRAYRQLVAKTQHLLIGDFVVKLFRME